MLKATAWQDAKELLQAKYVGEVDKKRTAFWATKMGIFGPLQRCESLDCLLGIEEELIMISYH